MFRFITFVLLATFFWQAACQPRDVENKARYTVKQQYYANVENTIRVDTVNEYSYLPEATVYFDFNKYDITIQSKNKLNNFYSEVIEKEPYSQFYVEGNTDTSGTQEYNLILSEKRANAVISYLESLGASPNMFKVLARGELNPIANDDEHPELNRRVIVYRKTKN